MVNEFGPAATFEHIRYQNAVNALADTPGVAVVKVPRVP